MEIATLRVRIRILDTTRSGGGDGGEWIIRIAVVGGRGGQRILHATRTAQIGRHQCSGGTQFLGQATLCTPDSMAGITPC